MNKAMGVTDQIPFITAGGSWIYFLDGFVLSTETPLLKLYKFTNLEDFYRVYKPRTNCL